MRDLLPSEVVLRRHLLGRIVEVYERYGFLQIETPLLEEIDRLLGSEGGENEKLIYKVLRRGIETWPPATEGEAVDLGLRYDLTVPLARYFASHSADLPVPFKALQTGPVFRAERPQKGRYRQFTQCDIDVLGDASAMAEIELVCATSEALAACGLDGITVRMNHRGVLDGMVSAAGYDADRKAAVLITIDKIDKIGLDGVRTELRALGDPGPADRLADMLAASIEAEGSAATLAALPATVDEVAVADLETIRVAVREALPWVEVAFDASLVRGMGYYTGPIFELAHDESSGSLGGGGRYDRMVGKLSGQDVPAVGMSIGFERLCHVLEGRARDWDRRDRIVFLHDAMAPAGEVVRQANALRGGGAVVRREVAVKNRRGQLARAAAAGCSHWAEYRAGEEPVVQALDEENEEGTR